MALNREQEGEALLVQLWSADMTGEVENASFVRFDRNFASKLRCLILRDNPKIPKALMHLVRPMDTPHNLKFSHNWGDIIPYSVSLSSEFMDLKEHPMYCLIRCP